MILKYSFNEYKKQEDYISETKAIIVGGSGRCGTTLMRIMLDSHKHICCGPESQFFFQDEIDVNVLAHNFEMSPDTITEIFQKSASKGEFVDKFSSEYCRLNVKKRWAEKSPKNVIQLDYIFRTFPYARFIHMIRDGRDVSCSLRAFPRHKVVYGKLIPLNTWKPIGPCIERWVSTIEDSRKYLSDPRYLEIRYEDLVLNTRYTLEKVFSFLEEPWDDNVLQYHTIDTPSRNITKFPQNPEAVNPLTNNAIGRWKTDFTIEDKRLFKRMGGDLLVELGYESSNNW